MTASFGRRALVAGTAAAVIAPAARAADPIRLWVSLDSLPSHRRTIAVADFLAKLDTATQGRIKPQLFHSSALFSDLNVPRALFQNQVDMALPGTWVLTGFVPSCEIVQLPAMYSIPLDTAHRVTDGKTGAAISDELDQKLKLHTLGPGLDLGYTQWYSATRPLNSLADLHGMKIRNSGGAGQGWRADYFGAIPNTTSWPNVPLSLAQGTFDGLQSTHESVASAKLWESGLKYALEDDQSFSVYIPLVTNAFWASLTPDLQQIMTALWADNIAGYRKAMIAAQATARETLGSHGVKVVRPSDQALTDARTAMSRDQDKLVTAWKINPAVAGQMIQEVNSYKG
jgi:C4-dicarboxylate-binding protein DctP